MKIGDTIKLKDGLVPYERYGGLMLTPHLIDCLKNPHKIESIQRRKFFMDDIVYYGDKLPQINEKTVYGFSINKINDISIIGDISELGFTPPVFYTEEMIELVK